MFWNLRNKLLVPTIVMFFLGSFSISFFSYMAAKDNVEKLIRSDATGMAEDIGDTLSLIFGSAYMDANNLASRDSVLALLGGDKEAIPFVENQMKGVIAIQPFYTSMTVLDAKGVIVASSSGSRGGKRDDRDYFKTAIQGKFAVSAPSTSKTTKASIIIFAAPVVNAHKETIGVATAVMDLVQFSERYVKHFKLGDAGYALIVDAQGRIVAHHNTEMIAEDLSPAITAKIQAMQGNKGSFTMEIDGVLTHFFVQKEEKSGWTGVILARDDDLFQEVRRMALISFLLAAICIVLTGAVTFFVVRGVTNDLSKGVAFASAVARGDLDETLDVKRNDELGILSSALGAMVANLKSMIATSEQKSHEAQTQSEKAANAMREAEEARHEAEQAKKEGMRQAAEQLGSIATALTEAAQLLLEQVGQAAGGSDKQRQRAENVAHAMGQMSHTVIDVARSATSAADSAEQTKHKAESGSQVVSGVLQAVADVDAKTVQLKSHMHELGETAQSISRIMGVINDIADQTNLLALNAAIEAARAGEAGRGFAVVADEVRKLAEKTMGATREVGQAVTAIQSGTEANIQSMEEASLSVSQSASLANEADAALQEIVSIAEITADKVQSIASASEEQSATSEEISHSIGEINDIAHETSVLMSRAHNAVDSLMGLTRQINELVASLKKA